MAGQVCHKNTTLSVFSAASLASTIQRAEYAFRQDLEKVLGRLHVKALEVQHHDLRPRGANDMRLNLGIKQFYTAIVAFSSPIERDAGTKIRKEQFSNGQDNCKSYIVQTKQRCKGSLSVHSVQQAVEVLIKASVRILKPDDEVASVCIRFGMVVWMDAIEHNTSVLC